MQPRMDTLGTPISRLASRPDVSRGDAEDAEDAEGEGSSTDYTDGTDMDNLSNHEWTQMDTNGHPGNVHLPVGLPPDVSREDAKAHTRVLDHRCDMAGGQMVGIIQSIDPGEPIVIFKLADAAVVKPDVAV